MSVSPLTRPMLDKIQPNLFERLMACKNTKSELPEFEVVKKPRTKAEKGEKLSPSEKKFAKQQAQIAEQGDNVLSLGSFLFETKKIKGKKTAILPLEQFKFAIMEEKNTEKLKACAALRGRIETRDHGTLLDGEKLELIIKICKEIDLNPIAEKKWNRGMNVNIYNQLQKEQLIDSLDWILKTSIAKQKGKEYGFITLYTDGKGNYWFKVSKGWSTALMESHASLEAMVDEQVELSKEEEQKINQVLALINKFYE